MAAELQHAERLGQRSIDARHVADAERDGDGIEARDRRTAAPRRCPRRKRCRVAPRSRRSRPTISMSAIDVEHGNACAGPAGLRDPQRDVAGAARDIEQRERCRAARRIDRRHQRVLPGAVQSARHQVVHQVVAPRHRVEHVVDHRLLFGERHPADSRNRPVVRSGPSCLSCARQIARHARQRYKGAEVKGRRATKYQSAT